VEKIKACKQKLSELKKYFPVVSFVGYEDFSIPYRG
jgi:hypothetical protein